MNENILYVVHCVDTEGPLDEKLEDTFERVNKIFGLELKPSMEVLEKLQKAELELCGKEKEIQKMVSPELLSYNKNWDMIDEMLDTCMSEDFRNKNQDDFGEGWVYSWHCMDHVDYDINPRNKDIGYGHIFQHYKARITDSKDELNWHFHPRSLSRNPLHGATSYNNSIMDLIYLISRRIIDDNWFPTVNRPGFHSERSDSNLFLEQWIPFDYANQSHEEQEQQPDARNGRFGDWGRASKSWRGYHPSIRDHQGEGNCNRVIFRCLNVGTRLRLLQPLHIRQAFEEAEQFGSAVLAFADHDYRNIRKDVYYVRNLIEKHKGEYSVSVKFSGAENAAVKHLKLKKKDFRLVCKLEGNRFYVSAKGGHIFGSQPFLSIKTTDGKYLHDNLDELEHEKTWGYVFDDQTIKLDEVHKIGVGSAGRSGGHSTCVINLK
jgi:hypothetical protein